MREPDGAHRLHHHRTGEATPPPGAAPRRGGMSAAPLLAGLAVALLIACGGSSPAVHPATVAARAFYAWYATPVDSGGAGFRFTAATAERASFFSRALRAALAADERAAAAEPNEIVGLDFDPLLASQEPCERYEPGEATVDGGRIVVTVRERCAVGPSRERPVTVEFVEEAGAWRVDDVVYDGGDRLTAILARYAAARDTAPC